MPEPIFQPLPDKPDHPGLEQEMLARWDAEETFAKLREQNRGGPTFSFVDGPVTANRMSLGVHTAWGRTLKDVFQRYKALRGFDERYQNGFDCQGLWIEVGVERSLGLNSKREIEEFGLEEFARRCREVVVQSSEALTRGSIRLGQWMDWGRDYFTFSDTNIEYIWKFLKIVHGRGWLYMGHRATEWCPRCGTSLSQHELTQGGVYQERADPSLFVRFPLLDFEGQSVVIWTTTPWTLPANVAAAVHPDEEYGRRANGEWVAVKLFPEDTFVERLPGRELVGRRYQGPFDDLPPGSQVEHRVIPWDDVTMDQGTGVVHIAPGAGGEDFELSRVHDLPVLSPVDESGRFYDDYGWLHGLTTTEAADQIIGRLGETGFLVEAGLFTHAYPHCWRCDTPLIFRLSDDWFIAVDEIRPTLLDENAKVEWVPEYMGKRMDDWLRNMGDWNISRRRYYGLPLPFYPCSCGHLNIIGSRGELEERALGGLEQLEELRRPWIDRVPIRCESCGEPVERIPEVGDVWLDAGIVPFATLGWENPQWVEEGYATGAARGLTKADLPDHEYWEKWFPADWVSEMREQIRLWFYSQFFMSVALVGRSPYQRVLGYEKMLDEQGREMHASWGNTIPAEDAFARMGADVMRWQYCAQPPERNLLFGFGPAETIKREFLTFWNSVKFFVDYANIADFRSSWSALNLEGVLDPLDRWLVERTHAFVRDAETAYEGYLTVDVMRAYTEYTEDLSNWYIRRSRRRFWDGDDHAPFQTLWYAIAQTLRVMAPILPFVTDHLWRTLVLDGPESVHLAGWPEVPEPDEELLEEVAEVRTVVRLAHQARAVSGQRLRQPFRRLATSGAERSVQRWWDVIADEVRVKQHSPMPVTKFQLKPNLKTLGPRLGKDLRVVQEALSTGESIEQLPDGSFRVNGFDLTEDDVLSANRVSVDPDWVVAEEGDISVALDTKLDDDLLLEARALDLVRTINQLRKDEGLELTDRIVLTVPDSEADVVNRHREYVEQEVLATELRVAGDVLTLEKS